MTSEIPHRNPDDPAIRGALSALRAWDDAAPRYDVDAGARRFAATLGVPPVPPEPSGSPAPATSRPSWLVPGLGIAAAVVLVAVAALGRDAPISERGAPSVAHAPSATEQAPPDEESPPDVADPRAVATRVTAPPTEASRAEASPTEAAPAEASPAEASPTEASPLEASPSTGHAGPGRASARPESPARKSPVLPPKSTKPATADSVPPETAPTEDSPSELALVRAMRAALRRDPGEALELGRQLDRVHPRGLLLEEREALRVFALEAAGRDAASAAAAFLAQHPSSAFAPRMRAIAGTEKKNDAGREDSGTAVQQP